jgi:hypothetical protein
VDWIKVARRFELDSVRPHRPEENRRQL